MITVPSETFGNYTMYGTIKFSVSLQDLINTYIDSIAPGQQSNLLYKKAGTLQYEGESCYVIIPCVAKDSVDTLPQFSTLKNLSDLVIKQPFLNLNDEELPSEDINATWDVYTLVLYYPIDHSNKSLSLDPHKVTLSHTPHSY